MFNLSVWSWTIQNLKNNSYLEAIMSFPGGSVVKNLPATQEQHAAHTEAIHYASLCIHFSYVIHLNIQLTLKLLIKTI